MNQMEDTQIISQVIAGESEKFGLLVERYQDMVFTICVRVLQNDFDAQEVAQDAFMQAFHKLGSYQGNAKFSTWLYTISCRLAISKLRQVKRKVQTSTLEESESEAHHIAFDWPYDLEHSDKKDYIKKSLKLLNEAESVALTLFYLDECEVKEVAQIMERTESSVKVLLYRGRKSLYAALQTLLKGDAKAML